MFVKQQQSLTI